jgi:hypothetical protein
MYAKMLLRPDATTLAVITAFATAMVSPSAQALDASLPAYRPVEALSGHLKSVGSDTLGQETELLAKAFQKIYSDVKVEIEATGSATAPLALLERRSRFGPMSRPMTAEETAAFEGKFGYKVSSFRVAVDALAVYVNKANPIACLRLPQLSGIFSSNRKAPGSGDVRTWVLSAGLANGRGGRSRSKAAIRCRERMSISARRRYTAATTSRRSNSSRARKRWCRRSRRTSMPSAIPVSAIRTKGCVPCRSRRITALLAMRLPPTRHCRASTQ